MSLLKRLVLLLQSLFGRRPGARTVSDALTVMPSEPPLAEAATAFEAAPPLLLHSEEMLDRAGRLAGYRYRPMRFETGRRLAPTYVEALAAAGVRKRAERRATLIELSATDWVEADFATLVGPHTVFLVGPVGTEGVMVWLAALRAIRRSGAGVALRWHDGDPDLADGLALATHVVIDFAGAPVERIEQTVARLQVSHPALHRVFEQVASWPERHFCVGLGADWVLGDFLATFEPPQPRRRGLVESRLVLIDLLNRVRAEAEVATLAEIAKRDPGVAVRLLAMANAPVHGLAQPVTGIEQAILVIGRQALYRWLAISIYRVGSDPVRDATLLEVALARAHFLERLATATGGAQPQADELFLVGLLSFADTLLGLPMAEVIAAVTLPEAVRDVLLASRGPYARPLMLAITVERGQIDQVAMLAGELGLGLDEVRRHRDAALLWAEEAVQA